MTEVQSSTTRLMRADLWILIVLGIAGITFFLLKFNESFPAASIDLKLSKSQIAEHARRWANDIGYPTAGSIESTVFTIEHEAKTFLEYELGQGQANALMRDTVPVWQWRTRFCRPFQQEECAVAIRPDGRLGYFDRSMPNDAKLPSISHQNAQTLAKDFVEKKAGLSLAGAKLIDDSEEKEVNRTDHYFTWEDETREFKGGRLRTYVYVSGNAVTQFNKYLHVPDKFERKYAEIRSWNELLKSISSIVYVVLSSAISFLFIWAFANGKIRWKFALIAAAFGMLLGVLNWIDGWPSLIASYPTTTPFSQYMTESVISMLVASLFAGIASMVFVGALEPIYRSMFPEKVALEKLMTVTGLRSTLVFRTLVAGLCVFGLHTAYVVAFYLVGQHLNFWSPLEVRDAATLSGLIPVYEAINIGIVASVTEELMYRVLALWLFQKLTRNFWAANFLQAVSWAFMHSDYPQEPAYARGVELTIGGFFYGWVLRSFGLLACVLAHYTYDAFLGVTPLISSQSPADRWIALIAIAPGFVALAVSSFLIWRKGQLTDASEILNSSIVSTTKPPPFKVIEPAVEVPYAPLSRKIRIGILAVAIVLLSLSAFVKMRTVGQNTVLKVSRNQSVQIAAEYLMTSGISTKGMRSVAWLTDQADQTELQYIFEQVKYARTKELAKTIEPRLLWRVRFFKESDPTEYYATVSTDGKPQARFVVKEEATPGAKLEPPQAQKLVTDFLAAQHADLSPIKFEDITRHDRDARIDYDVEYSVPHLKVGEADYQVHSGTVGGDVSGLSRGWKLPDQWIYERQKVTQKDQIFNVVSRIMAVVIVLLILWWLVDIIRAHVIRWKPAIVVGCIGAVTTLVGYLNSLPTLFISYQTEEAIRTFLMEQVVQHVIGILSGVAAMTLMAAFSYGAFRKLFPGLTLSAMFRPILPKGLGGAGSNRTLWLDAVIIAYGVSVIALCVDFFFDVGRTFTSPSVHLYDLSSIRNLADEWSPSVGAIASSISSALSVPMIVALGVSFVDKFLGRSFWKALAVFAVVFSIGHASSRYWQDYLWQVAGALALIPIIFWYLRWARLNLLAYALTGYLGAITSATGALIRSGYELYFGHIAVLVLALVAPLIYTLWLYLPVMKRSPSEASDPAVSR